MLKSVNKGSFTINVDQNLSLFAPSPSGWQLTYVDISNTTLNGQCQRLQTLIHFYVNVDIAYCVSSLPPPFAFLWHRVNSIPPLLNVNSVWPPSRKGRKEGTTEKLVFDDMIFPLSRSWESFCLKKCLALLKAYKIKNSKTWLAIALKINKQGELLQINILYHWMLLAESQGNL